MLSSSCDSEVEVYMHITIEAGLACTLFDTAGIYDLSSCYHHRRFIVSSTEKSSSLVRLDFDRHIVSDSSLVHLDFDKRYGEQKIAQFRTHYLTKESPYVSTQQSGQDTMETKMI